MHLSYRLFTLKNLLCFSISYSTARVYPIKFFFSEKDDIGEDEANKKLIIQQQQDDSENKTASQSKDSKIETNTVSVTSHPEESMQQIPYKNSISGENEISSFQNIEERQNTVDKDTPRPFSKDLEDESNEKKPIKTVVNSGESLNNILGHNKLSFPPGNQQETFEHNMISFYINNFL